MARKSPTATDPLDHGDVTPPLTASGDRLEDSPAGGAAWPHNAERGQHTVDDALAFEFDPQIGDDDDLRVNPASDDDVEELDGAIAAASAMSSLTQRGLLIVGSVSLLLLLLVLISRPQPTGPPAPPDRPDVMDEPETENAISARQVDAPEVFGASSKTGQPPTTAAPETTVTVPPTEPPPSTAPATTAPPQNTGAAPAWPIPEIRVLGRVHEVANPQQWRTALAAAQPGDVIKLVATIREPLAYRGGAYDAANRNGPDGTADRPITITAADGVWIDPGNKSNLKPGLDIMYTSHVNVIGVRVRNSQFGIRVLGSSGSAQSPIVIAGNTVTDIGHAGIHVGANFENRQPSRFVQVQGNTVTLTGRTAPQFGEGVYLGYGKTEWVDESSDIQVVGNLIYQVTAEGIDIKPGVRRVLVENNQIHDVAPLAGGAISATYVNTTRNPKPSEPMNIVIRNNRIWNVNLNGVSGSNDWAIWVGHGGVTVEGNAIWGMRGDPNSTRAVRVRATQEFGSQPIRIVNNTFWTATGWKAEGSPSGAGLVQASGNRGPSGAAGIEVPMGQPGGVPAVGSGGTADNGAGPGSALVGS